VFGATTSSALLAYSKQADEFETLPAGASLTAAKSLAFISASTLLVSSFGSDEVRV
jgi:hypothetical protein